jgi:hypothetical protein
VNIVTFYSPPPIPIRGFDWVATFEDYEGGEPIGYGETEEEARASLLEQAGDEYQREQIETARSLEQMRD